MYIKSKHVLNWTYRRADGLTKSIIKIKKKYYLKTSSGMMVWLPCDGLVRSDSNSLRAFMIDFSISTSESVSHCTPVSFFFPKFSFHK